MSLRAALCLALLAIGGCGGDDSAQSAPPVAAPSPSPTPTATPTGQPSDGPVLTIQERQCQAAGWQLAEVTVAGRQRRLMWRGPASGTWTRGAIVILHGGGGNYYNFCVANDALIGPQVRFTDLAREQGFAVLTLQSTDQVTDNQGRLCGKVWDDEVRGRPNLDLPFMDQVIDGIIPSLRKPGDNSAVFITGLSSGGYMSSRAATHLGNRLTAFAPVSSGDPYGWTRICERGPDDRDNVFGAGFDNETGKQIVELNSCLSPQYPNEKTWNEPTGRKAPFRMFHDENDAINDISCGRKIDQQLRLHGYPGEAPFLLKGNQRAAIFHFWQDGYNQPILDFFVAAGARSANEP